MKDHMYLVDTYELWKGKMDRTSQLLFNEQEHAFNYMLGRQDLGEWVQVKKVYIMDTFSLGQCVGVVPAP
jgi:hypothetical protein